MAEVRIVGAVLGVFVMACGCGTPSPAQPRTSHGQSIHVERPRAASSAPRTSSRPGLLANDRSRRHRPRWASGAGAPTFPIPAEVNQRSADAVALSGAVAMASADTTVDGENPQHAAVRAAWAGWLTPQYAQRVLTAQIIGPSGAEWETWYRHRAYVVATASPSGEDHPPDTATVAARKVVLRERVIGRDGWHTPTTSVVVAVVVRKVHEVWRIDSDQPS